MAYYYNFEGLPISSVDVSDVLDTLIWDEDMEEIPLTSGHSFDPVCEALTLGAIKGFQVPDKIGNTLHSNESDTTTATTPMVESSQSHAINLLDQISKDLEPTGPIDLLHQQCSAAINKFSCDVGLYSDLISSTASKIDSSAGDLVDIYTAKVNISETILSLKRFATFLSLVTTASTYLANKDYGTIAFILLVCKNLLISLESVINIITFQKFTEYYNKFCTLTRVSIEKDLNSILNGIDLAQEYKYFKTNECCLCLDLIDTSIKCSIIEQVVDKFMDQYKQCFRGSDRESAEFSRRISWFRRNLPSVNDTEKHFPPNWNFTINFTKQFFIESSKDLETLLAKHKSPLVEADLYSMVKMCKEFELEQNETQLPNRIVIRIIPNFDILEYPIVSSDELKLEYTIESEKVDFSGHFTNCFEGYLGSWLYSQETSLNNFLLPLDNNEIIIQKNDLNVYNSAFQLFTKFRNILSLAMSVSTEQTLLEAFQMLKRVLKLYHQLLIGKWGFGDNRDFDKLCSDGGVLVGTSLYCETMFVDMENKTCQVIRDLYRPICKRHDILDIFSSFRSSIIYKVINEISTSVDIESGYFEKIAQFKAPVDNFIMDIVMICDAMLNVSRNNFPVSCYEYICNKIARYLLKSFKDGVCNFGEDFASKLSAVTVKQINLDIVLLEKYLIGMEIGEGSRNVFNKHMNEEIAFITKYFGKLQLSSC